MNFIYDLILISGIGDDVVALEPERDLRSISDEFETYTGTSKTLLSSQKVRSTEKYFAMELDFEPNIICLSSLDTKKTAHGELLKFIHPEEGIRLTTSERRPTFHSFVLTTMEGDLKYGFSLKKSVPFSKQKRDSLIELASKHERIRGTEGLPNTLFSERALTIISKFNYSNTFLTILAYFVRSEPPNLQLNETSPSRLSSILSKIDRPQLGISPPKIRFGAYTSIKFPEFSYPYELPNVDIEYKTLFQCLSAEKIVEFITAIFNEKKIIAISKDYQKIVDCTETIRSLIYPFAYPYIYIPILPLSLLPIFEAPVTYLVGCHASILEVEIPPDDVIIVDLDHNFITANDPITALPHRISTNLLEGIKKNCNLFQKPKKTGRSFLILENSPIVLQNKTSKFKNTSFSSSGSSNMESTSNSNIESMSEEANSRVNLENFFNKNKNNQISINRNKNQNQNNRNNINKKKIKKKIKKIRIKNKSKLQKQKKILTLNKEEIFNLKKMRLLFLDFIVDLIERYYPFIIVPDPNNKRDFNCFDLDGFLNQAKEENMPFLKKFLFSQMFIYFIEGKVSNGLNEQTAFDLKMNKKLNYYLKKYSIENSKSQSGLVDVSINNGGEWVKLWVEVINQQLSISYKPQKRSKNQTTTFISLQEEEVNIYIPKKLQNPPTNFYFTLQIKDQFWCFCTKTKKSRNKWITAFKTQSMDQNYLKKMALAKKVPKEVRKRFELNKRKNSTQRVNTFRASWKKKKRLTINLGNLKFRTFQTPQKNNIILNKHTNISARKEIRNIKQLKNNRNNYSINQNIVFPIVETIHKNHKVDHLLKKFQNNLSSQRLDLKETKRQQNIINKSLLIESDTLSSISIINKKKKNGKNNGNHDHINRNLSKSKSQSDYVFEKKDFKLIDKSFVFSNESTTDFDSSSDIENNF
ncbi:c-myc promoter binding protein [Anaeramoeba flamelloides]|uniref:C-myc promoter binding protein n=1 Tax=Anaeramoeba flamelloides TaxID=1746091 RepID=A0AAV8A9E8_9EUKA|nr:c-myc promoter binding protein [Anaeramoeba flamelloides]